MATAVRSSMKEAVRDLSAWTPAWEKAQMFPVRYACTEADYFSLDTNRRVEFAERFIEVLPARTTTHQLVLIHVVFSLNSFPASKLGNDCPCRFPSVSGREGSASRTWSSCGSNILQNRRTIQGWG